MTAKFIETIFVIPKKEMVVENDTFSLISNICLYCKRLQNCVTLDPKECSMMKNMSVRCKKNPASITECLDCNERTLTPTDTIVKGAGC